MTEGSRHAVWPVLALCAGSIAAAMVLEWRGSDAYRVVLGVAHPVAGTIVIVGLGFAALELLRRREWIASEVEAGKGWAAAAALGALLPIPIIVVDCLGGFGADLNVRAPDALFFYPSVALLAELVFHVAPLALGALLAGAFTRAAERLESLALALAVAAEPVLQVTWGAVLSPLWANAYAGLHLLVFNAIGVLLLRRYGLMRAYLYRVSYYAVWHMVWGELRLSVLFTS